MLLTLAVVSITMIFLSIRAASSNPVNALRSE